MSASHFGRESRHRPGQRPASCGERGILNSDSDGKMNAGSDGRLNSFREDSEMGFQNGLESVFRLDRNGNVGNGGGAGQLTVSVLLSGPKPERSTRCGKKEAVDVQDTRGTSRCQRSAPISGAQLARQVSPEG